MSDITEIKEKLEYVELTAEYLVGHGGHKYCYLDPRDFSRCIKVMKNMSDDDYKKEKYYRKVLRVMGCDASILPKYYGPVDTNLGKGFVFEFIRDYNGAPSKNLLEYIKASIVLVEKDYHAVRRVSHILRIFRDQYIENDIQTWNMEFENFMIQKQSESYTDFRVRIVDNIGSHAAIPVSLFSTRLSRHHNIRYWDKFLKELHGQYPQYVTQQVFESLL